MRRRLYYRDSYGRWQEDRQSGRRPGMPGKGAVIALALLAAIMVLASVLQSFYQAAYHAVKP